MSRWELLKESLRKGRNAASNSSIHAFPGHSLIEKVRIIWPGYKVSLPFEKDADYKQFMACLVHLFSKTDCCEVEVTVIDTDKTLSIDTLTGELGLSPELTAISLEEKLSDDESSAARVISILLRNRVYTPLYSSCCFFKYCLPSGRNVFTRELPEKRKITANDIISDVLFGVDNTGNICTWPSESILLHVLLTVSWIRTRIMSKQILEIGGGQTALAGLGLAVEGVSDNIIITDGHPNCVINQGVCIQCCRRMGAIPSTCKIENILLEWSNFGDFPPQSVDVVIGSDCLFFKDFHDALLSMLDHILVPNGVIILLQPPRGDSLDIFVKKAEAFFNVNRYFDYCAEMSEQRDEFLLKQQEHYNLDKHYPILLELTRKI
jgi:hypothetical protein